MFLKDDYYDVIKEQSEPHGKLHYTWVEAYNFHSFPSNYEHILTSIRGATWFQVLRVDYFHSWSDSWYYITLFDHLGLMCDFWMLPKHDCLKLASALILGVWSTLVYSIKHILFHHGLALDFPAVDWKLELQLGDNHHTLTKTDLGSHRPLVFSICLWPVPFSFYSIRSTYMYHVHIVRRDPYPNSQFHTFLHICQDPSITGPLSWDFLTFR